MFQAYIFWSYVILGAYLLFLRRVTLDFTDFFCFLVSPLTLALMAGVAIRDLFTK